MHQLTIQRHPIAFYMLSLLLESLHCLCEEIAAANPHELLKPRPLQQLICI